MFLTFLGDFSGIGRDNLLTVASLSLLLPPLFLGLLMLLIFRVNLEATLFLKEMLLSTLSVFQPEL